MLILLEMKIQPPVPVWWIADHRSLHFPVWPSLELLPRRCGLGIQDSWHVPGFRGWLSYGLATTDKHLLPATIRKHDVLGTTLSDQEPQQDLELQRGKGKNSREPQGPKNSPLSLFLVFVPWLFSSCWIPLFSMRSESLLKDKFIQRPH